MSGLGNEFTLVEKAALDYLVDILGYTYIDASKLSPSFNERGYYFER